MALHMSRIWYGWRKATLLSSLIRRKEASPFVALREALQGADTGASSSAPHWCEGSAIHSTAEGFRMRLLKSIHTLNGVFHHHTTSKRVLCCHKEMCLSRHRLCLVATCFRPRTLARVCVYRLLPDIIFALPARGGKWRKLSTINVSMAHFCARSRTPVQTKIREALPKCARKDLKNTLCLKIWWLEWAPDVSKSGPDALHD